MAIVGKKPQKARQGRPPTKTPTQRYRAKNKSYINSYKRLKYELDKNKITNKEYQKEIIRIKKKYNKK